MLEINNLSKKFNPGTINEKIALENLSLNVEDGEVITILGANGSGKTTLFNAIAGVFIPDEGQILMDKENITFKPDFERAKYIGRLFQDPLKGTAPHMTIEENLALAYLRAGTSKQFSTISKKDRELFYEQLKMLDMGLEDRMHTLVGTLSGGQRQALTLLMATIVPPKILLLDEHTAALDPLAAEKVLELTNEIIKREEMTCLMITHNIRQALMTGTRTIFMNEGRIVLDLKGDERKDITMEEIMQRFKMGTGKELEDERLILGD